MSLCREFSAFKGSVFQAWSRSEYTFACLIYGQEINLVPNFCVSLSFAFICYTCSWPFLCVTSSLRCRHECFSRFIRYTYSWPFLYVKGCQRCRHKCFSRFPFIRLKKFATLCSWPFLCVKGSQRCRHECFSRFPFIRLQKFCYILQLAFLVCERLLSALDINLSPVSRSFAFLAVGLSL